MNLRANKPTLVTAWHLYDQGIPPQAGLVQRQETEKAFFSGALAVLKLIDDLNFSGDIIVDRRHALLRVLEAEAAAATPEFASLFHERRVP
jgi:hypothetical protein